MSTIEEKIKQQQNDNDDGMSKYAVVNSEKEKTAAAKARKDLDRASKKGNNQR